MNNKLCINILKLRHIMNQYKSGKKFTDINVDIDYDSFCNTALYLLDIDYFDNYELSFLSQFDFGDMFLRKLLENCKDITDEEILCIERDEFISNFIHFNKIANQNNIIDFVQILDSIAFKMPRREVEYSKKYLQLIPYMVITTQNNDIVLLEKKKGDNRLISRIDFPSGHCNKDTILESIFNELKEELGIDRLDIDEITPISIIPIEDNIFSISHYHLGIVFNIKLEENTNIINNEPEKHNIIYYSEIRSNPEKLTKLSNWCTYGLYKYLEYLDILEIKNVINKKIKK